MLPRASGDRPAKVGMEMTSPPDVEQTWDVAATGDGRTILQALRERFAGLSWSAAKQLVERRRVTINGVACRSEAHRLRTGDRIGCGGQRVAALPGPDDVQLLAVDDAIVFVEKPSGMLSERRVEERGWSPSRKRESPTLDEAVPELLRNRDRLRSTPRVYCVHRLDQEASGVMVFARTPAARESLVRQFREHSMERVYWAVVLGDWSQSKTVSAALVRDRGDGRRGVAGPGQVGERAVTHIRPLKRRGDCTLVECRLETGRTHQIRLHATAEGTLIAGDGKYGLRADGSRCDDRSGAPRLALHARRLTLEHPVTGAAVSGESEWPSDLAAWWSAGFPSK